MTEQPRPVMKEPKGDHNRRLALGLDADTFAANAGISAEQLRTYELTGPDGDFDIGEVNGKAASGCALMTGGKLDAPLNDQLKALFPDVPKLAAPEPAGSGITLRRSFVEIAGKASIWSVVERDDPSHGGFEIKLERLPQSFIDEMGLSDPR